MLPSIILDKLYVRFVLIRCTIQLISSLTIYWSNIKYLGTLASLGGIKKNCNWFLLEYARVYIIHVPLDGVPVKWLFSDVYKRVQKTTWLYPWTFNIYSNTRWNSLSKHILLRQVSYFLVCELQTMKDTEKVDSYVSTKCTCWLWL